VGTSAGLVSPQPSQPKAVVEPSVPVTPSAPDTSPQSSSSHSNKILKQKYLKALQKKPLEVKKKMFSQVFENDFKKKVSRLLQRKKIDKTLVAVKILPKVERLLVFLEKKSRT
jgi:hypothetical protein